MRNDTVGLGARIEPSRHSHERFRSIAENSLSAVLILDPALHVVYANAEAARITEYAPEELVGRDFLALVDPKTGPLVRDHSTRRRRGENAPSRYEFSILRKDGATRLVECSADVVRDADGNPETIMQFMDTTERHRAEEELKSSHEIFEEVAKNRESLETVVRERTKELEDAKQAADAASRAKSNFLAHMSHEIRTPINAIMGFSQLMQRDDTLAPQQRQHLDVINRSGEHLLALITDVLEMSKIEAGRTTMNPSTFSLRSLLEDLELMFRMRTDAKKLTFALEGLGHIPRYVEGDEGKLRQILINLLGNAVKFTETGGIVLRIETRPEAAGGIRLEAEVEDTGPGIPEDEQKDLFKPFQQARSGRLMRSGTGLGLAICKEFVTLMGGDISVVSQVGKGCLFKFHVRLGQGEVGFAEKQPESHRVKCLRPGQPVRRILIADDEELTGAFLSKLLGGVGFETRQVTDGNKAIEEFHAWHPHLILLDMRMPEMDGCEAARRIRASEGGRDVKIVSVSASAFEENRREALDAGADDYLTKPFREIVLFEKIERMLGVEYELSEMTTSEKDLARPAGRTALTADALAALPANFTRKMRDAVVKADYDRMIGLIDGIDGRCGPAVHELRGLVERFEYNRLLDLLQEKGKDR